MTISNNLDALEYGPAPESAAPAVDWVKQHGPQFRLFIGGTWREPNGRVYFDSINPATSKPLARIAQAGADDVDAAVKAAREAQQGWWEIGCHARARYLYAMARHVQRHSRLLAVLETLDNGKPIRETRDIDIPLVARHFYHHAGWAQLMESELPGYRPIGVAGQIIPWNFPLLMLAWKIAPAIAMGNTVVLKPAEFTSLTALAFAEICREIGLPHGVVNIVTGDGSTGELIVNHPGVDKIAFTGSTEVGRKIRQGTAGSGKRLSLELGGKSPFIVFEDADLDGAVEGIVDAIWFNQGQVCCAGSRLLVQESISNRLLAKIKIRMEKLRAGDPLDKAIDIGAIIAPVQLEKIQRLVSQGMDEGAEMWQPSWSCPADGCFYPPTLFTNVSPASTIAQVEIFGPVLVSMTFRTQLEAVQLANNTRYGLAASVWSENINLALDVAPKLKAGTVWINCTNLFDAASGFGGCRESGYGREGGREGLWEYIKPEWESGRGGEREKGYPQTASPTQVLLDPNPGSDGCTVSASPPLPLSASPTLPSLDRTPKLYIGGKQVRPDSGYSRHVLGAGGDVIGEVGSGNRKDIRNAVEAAHAAAKWAGQTAHLRAQILYYIAENLEARREEFGSRIVQMTGQQLVDATAEVEMSIRRLFTWAAMADKYDGAIHQTPFKMVTMAAHEPIGVVGIVCPNEQPLLGFISTVMPVVAMGNTVVAIPSETHPLAATDLYQVFDTSDLPGGVINIVTGAANALSEVLASHDDVDAMWYFGSQEGGAAVERASCGNMKRTWVNYGKPLDRAYDAETESGELLRQCTQIKNIWIPYGDGIPGLD